MLARAFAVLRSSGGAQGSVCLSPARLASSNEGFSLLGFACRPAAPRAATALSRPVRSSAEYGVLSCYPALRHLRPTEGQRCRGTGRDSEGAPCCSPDEQAKTSSFLHVIKRHQNFVLSPLTNQRCLCHCARERSDTTEVVLSVERTPW
jgi:hypothetical protein